MRWFCSDFGDSHCSEILYRRQPLRMRRPLLLLPLIALLTACQHPIRRDYCLRWMAIGEKVEAETKKALGLGETDDLEAFCKEYEDSTPSSGMFF